MPHPRSALDWNWLRLIGAAPLISHTWFLTRWQALKNAVAGLQHRGLHYITHLANRRDWCEVHSPRGAWAGLGP